MTGPLLLPGWDELGTAFPTVVDTMRRYLAQIGCILRPGSAKNADGAVRCFGAFLAERYSQTEKLGEVGRRHIEDYKPWLARPRQKLPRVKQSTIVHHLDTLRMFFVRITEWGRDDAPARVPILLGDVPRLDQPLLTPSTTMPQPSCCARPAPTGGSPLVWRSGIELRVRASVEAFHRRLSHREEGEAGQ